MYKFSAYLSQEARDGLHKFKYCGGDYGYAYVYFYLPFSLWILNFTPSFLAPNTITLIGFAFVIIPYVYIFATFGTTFNNEAEITPTWFFCAESFFYLLYRILDELDGKQARKTGNSSPVGLLFDHGCDAYTTTVIPSIIAKFMQ